MKLKTIIKVDRTSNYRNNMEDSRNYSEGYLVLEKIEDDDVGTHHFVCLPDDLEKGDHVLCEKYVYIWEGQLEKEIRENRIQITNLKEVK